MPSKNAEERILKATVLDSDRGKRYNVVGHALFPLKDIDLATDEMSVQWKDLIKDVDTVVPCDAGELLVSLCYNQNLERLTVTVCEAKGLKLPEGQTALDSFVKLIFLIENKQIKTKKTVAVKKSTDPKLLCRGPNKDKIVGRVVFGSYMFVRGKPLEHWNEAISAGHKQIRHWQKLTL
ncbi:hypothetical protein CEXT_380231 [Caerostris extrusa]|uniref:C2 domain-containing protein n=1 Tax=Caerostris extrusa TaxID=172846 RepID=A0AAV4XLJ3_CAEEX|nr:hypothetical protein CEXT_380231 [Caerostris extrusa]